MKQRVLAISFLFIASSSFASTNVPNNLTGDNQWNADGNPYVIQGKTVLAKGATLRVGPNVKVVFQGNAALEVDGTLDVAGSAAAPAIFDMTQGGLQSELFLNGADAEISNAKFLSGVFLVQDSKLHMQWFEITKGSGLYLRGTGTATVKDGKIYGNATGVVLEGKVNATFRFNTITQNSYGLYLKGFSDLQFKNNSIHDNDKDVINNTPALTLGGNYWGTTDAKVAKSKMQGSVDLGPM
ncbi:MAG TPA: right-handed parallel beta-helix repeat-containing protein, partial [bacterium]|nr:right-handed parallel beta-helix repeat-containing protein [bacterium]